MKDKLDPTEYEQMFSVNGMSFLTSDSFMGYYKNLHAIALFAHGTWVSYIPKSVSKRTRQEGKEIFGSREKLEQLKSALNTYYSESAVTFENILSKSTLTREDCQTVLDAMSANYIAYSKTEFFYTDEAFKDSERDTLKREIMSELGELKNVSREKMNKVLYQPDSYRKVFMQKIASQFGLTKSEMASYGVADVLRLFEGTRLSPATIEARSRAYLMSAETGTVTYMEGTEAEDFAGDFLAHLKPETDKKEFKGVIACKGKGIVTAPATVIQRGGGMAAKFPEIIAQMPDGNILVADTTSPELLIACKKASAIITNQGGMMSHAAIVSRELGIPCVVGLNSVTAHIQNGDILEVDGEKGMVRVVS